MSVVALGASAVDNFQLLDTIKAVLLKNKDPLGRETALHAAAELQRRLGRQFEPWVPKLLPVSSHTRARVERRGAGWT